MINRGAAGFTLVELIVAVVIVAVLAAIGIPIYIGYQVDARRSSADQLARTAAAAADGYYRKTGSNPSKADLNLYYDSTRYTVSIDSASGKVSVVADDGYTRSIPFK